MTDSKKPRLINLAAMFSPEAEELWDIPSKDSQGHSVCYNFKLTGGLAMDVATKIESKKYPYKTRSALLRHAVVNHLHFLDRLSNSPSKILVAEMEILDDLFRQARNTALLQIVDSMQDDAVDKLSAGVDIAIIRSDILKIYGRLSNVDGKWGPIYRQRIREKMGRYFEDGLLEKL
jgi:hypothetical protein